MSFDPQYLKVPVRALTINGEEYPILVKNVTLTREVDGHDSAQLSASFAGEITFDGKVRVPLEADDPLSGTRDVDPQSMVGQRVSFIYGVSPRTEMFVGYISSVVPESRFKSSLNYVVNMLGATAVMQSVKQRFDKFKMVHEAVRDRAYYRYLGFIGDTHPFVLSAVAQSSDTDWEKCISLARFIGYALFNWNGVVRLHNPVNLFTQYPYTTLTMSDNVLDTDRKLMDFKPGDFSDLLLAKQPVEASYFDSGGTVHTYRQESNRSNPSYQPVTAYPAASETVAQVMIDASKITMLRWTQAGTARISGDASIYPGMIVTINSGNSSSASLYNGRWLVAKVQHSMDRVTFNTELSVTRPPVVPMYTQSAFQHFWQATDRGRPNLSVREGEWFSSWADPSVRLVTP
jgi:hypothetical protein